MPATAGEFLRGGRGPELLAPVSSRVGAGGGSRSQLRAQIRGLQGPALGLDQGLTDGQAQTSAALVGFPAGVGAVEAFEDVGRQVGWGMPSPVSETVIVTASEVRSVRTVMTPPDRVWRSAFSSRLPSTWPIRSRSIWWISVAAHSWAGHGDRFTSEPVSLFTGPATCAHGDHDGVRRSASRSAMYSISEVWLVAIGCAKDVTTGLSVRSRMAWAMIAPAW